MNTWRLFPVSPVKGSVTYMENKIILHLCKVKPWDFKIMFSRCWFQEVISLILSHISWWGRENNSWVFVFVSYTFVFSTDIHREIHQLKFDWFMSESVFSLVNFIKSFFVWALDTCSYGFVMSKFLHISRLTLLYGDFFLVSITF